MGARRPRSFELRNDCTLETVGGLGLLWYDDEPFDSPMTLKVEWMIPGDANSGVFVGFPAVGNDPFVAVQRGYEVQIDPTDIPASTTGAIYSFQAADAAKRDQALRPPGQWNTYEITVDAPRLVVRLNGVVVNRFVSTSASARASPAASSACRTTVTPIASPSAACRSRSGAARGRGAPAARRGVLRPTLSRARASTAAAGTGSCGTTAAACTWAAGRSTSSSPAATSSAQQHGAREPRAPACAGGRVDDRDDRARPASLGLAAGGPARVPQRRRLRQARRGGRGRREVRFRLLGEAANAVVGNAPRLVAATAERHLPAAPGEVGLAYTGFWSLNGVSWRRLGSVVNTRLATRAAYGLLALGPGRRERRPTPRSSTFASDELEAEPGEGEAGDAEDDREQDPETVIAGGDGGDG